MTDQLDAQQERSMVEQAAWGPPYPYAHPLSGPVQEAHQAAIRRANRRYFRWGWLVCAPGIVGLSIGLWALGFRRGGRGEAPAALWLDHPALVVALIVGGIAMIVVAYFRMAPPFRTVERHRRLLDAYSVPRTRAGSAPIR